MSNTDRTGNTGGAKDPRKDGSLDPDAPVLKENAEADFGEKGKDLPDDQAGLSESEKLDDAVANLDKT